MFLLPQWYVVSSHCYLAFVSATFNVKKSLIFFTSAIYHYSSDLPRSPHGGAIRSWLDLIISLPVSIVLKSLSAGRTRYTSVLMVLIQPTLSSWHSIDNWEVRNFPLFWVSFILNSDWPKIARSLPLFWVSFFLNSDWSKIARSYL